MKSLILLVPCLFLSGCLVVPVASDPGYGGVVVTSPTYVQPNIYPAPVVNWGAPLYSPRPYYRRPIQPYVHRPPVYHHRPPVYHHRPPVYHHRPAHPVNPYNRVPRLIGPTPYN